MVTTHPVSAERLYHCVDREVKICGFGDEEVKEYLSIINTVLAFGLHVLTLCFSPVPSCHCVTGLTRVILTGLTLYVTVTDLLSHVILFLPTTAETHRRRNNSLLYCSPPRGSAPVCVLAGGGPKELFIWYASV